MGLKMPAGVRRKGQALLHQQCWNWGRDILRPEGNLLLEYGYERRRPPEGVSGSSRYERVSAEGEWSVLWGFGVFHGRVGQGGVFLNRYQFSPLWLAAEALEDEIWSPNAIPASDSPAAPETLADLTAAAARAFAAYERWALDRIGLSARRQILSEWAHAAKAVAPGRLPAEWDAIAEAVAASALALAL